MASNITNRPYTSESYIDSSDYIDPIESVCSTDTSTVVNKLTILSSDDDSLNAEHIHVSPMCD